MTTKSGYYVGQRLSLRSQTCTVRYVGAVEGKSGEWLGVEWDDTTRGKNAGTVEGSTYFRCWSKSATAASFIRPNQQWDKPSSFLQALKEKYVLPNVGLSIHAQGAIYFSSKQAEEVGFEKFAARQAELRGIRTLVLDRMRIRHSPSEDGDSNEITALCGEVTELDISGNLFETFEEVQLLCRCLPKLRSLTADANRLCKLDALGGRDHSLATIKALSLGNVLLDWDAVVVKVLALICPNLEALTASNNEWTHATVRLALSKLRLLELSGNEFVSLSDVSCVAGSNVETLLLRKCNVSAVWSQASSEHQLAYTSVTELDIRDNHIEDWFFFDELITMCPNLRHLRSAGNPLYTLSKRYDGKELAAEDCYMLTIARLPGLCSLNYSTITEKDRLNADVFYLNLIVAEAAASTPAARPAVLARHPRFAALCAEYGEPTILSDRHALVATIDRDDPNSLAARLVKMHFTHGSLQWEQVVPRSCSMYTLLGFVGKRLGIMPLKLRLFLSTNEEEPLARPEDYQGPVPWDSDDEQEAHELCLDPTLSASRGGSLARKVELTAGTRTLGTYLSGDEAAVEAVTK
ncbi:hypothetical protein BAUCODRAFT_200124 [Baudoinia panamericana UAMH 10762]|uniref:CAP-Gly domain-containing protein n=1 Tax=Baudoinia panamericana (strain UAMH 10762) TaxID=717646 RepID=M2MW30_BAUPA|nr:uncharacterized protein BAUCODRAFT_200124 [Baudoinia panamericana UAMH 10762]EMD01182.1 hypothetical protein BAUCODRAFT_200124 [Baudoinia panamericana UAMH 10762]